MFSDICSWRIANHYNTDGWDNIPIVIGTQPQTFPFSYLMKGLSGMTESCIYHPLNLCFIGLQILIIQKAGIANPSQQALPFSHLKKDISGRIEDALTVPFLVYAARHTSRLKTYPWGQVYSPQYFTVKKHIRGDRMKLKLHGIGLKDWVP